MKRDEKLEHLAATAEERNDARAAKVAKRPKVRAFKEEFHDRMRAKHARKDKIKAG